jgi:hypothetical protein
MPSFDDFLHNSFHVNDPLVMGLLPILILLMFYGVCLKKLLPILATILKMGHRHTIHIFSIITIAVYLLYYCSCSSNFFTSSYMNHKAWANIISVLVLVVCITNYGYLVFLQLTTCKNNFKCNLPLGGLLIEIVLTTILYLLSVYMLLCIISLNNMYSLIEIYTIDFTLLQTHGINVYDFLHSYMDGEKLGVVKENLEGSYQRTFEKDRKIISCVDIQKCIWESNRPWYNKVGLYVGNKLNGTPDIVCVDVSDTMGGAPKPDTGWLSWLKGSTGSK